MSCLLFDYDIIFNKSSQHWIMVILFVFSTFSTLLNSIIYNTAYLRAKYL